MEKLRNWFEDEYGDPRFGRIIPLGIAVVLIIVLVVASITIVPTGHTGVIATFGRVEDRTLDAGVHLVAPWQRVIKMDNRIQKHSVELSCFSSDIQEVKVVYTVNYQINKTNAMTIYATIGTNYFDTVITPNISEAVKVSAAKFTAESLVNDRNKLASNIETNLIDLLKQYNIEVIGTSIEDIDFTDAFTNAVEAKQVAQQDKLKAQTVAEQKVIEAEAAANVKKVNAEADANAKKIAADAAAYETRVKADAEAEANRKIVGSLTNELIDYVRANNWDGKYPTYFGGDGALVDLR